MINTIQKPFRLTGLLTLAFTFGGLGSLALTGCMFKKSLATPDSVMTGSGVQAKYLIPVPVEEEDGAAGYCVYVGGPDTDPSSIGTGQVGNAFVLTPVSISQGDFFNGLLNLQGVGGWGNTIVEDVSASLVAMAATTGASYVIGQKAAGVAAAATVASNGAPAGVKALLPAAEEVLNPFYSELAKGQGARLDLQEATVKTARKLNELLQREGIQSRNAFVLTQALQALDPDDVRQASSGKRLMLQAIKNANFEPQVQEQLIRFYNEGALKEIGDEFWSLRRGQLRIESAMDVLQAQLEKVRMAASQGGEGLTQLLNIASTERAKAASRISSSLGEFAGAAERGALSQKLWTGRVLDRGTKVIAKVARSELNEAAAAAAGSKGPLAGLKSGGKWLMSGVRNACLSPDGGPKQKVVGAMLCGLGAAGATWGVKKAVWEPATAGPKLAQVAAAMEDLETYHQVNPKTFEAIGNGIGSFEPSPFGKSCE